MMTGRMSANNMVLFDSESRIKRYANECEIIAEYFPVRLGLYKKRKDHHLGVLRREAKLMENKSKFIEGVNRNEVQLRDKTKLEIVA